MKLLLSEVWVIQNRVDQTLLTQKLVFENGSGFIGWPTEQSARAALDELYWLRPTDWDVVLA